jgi:hypothetical protein
LSIAKGWHRIECLVVKCVIPKSAWPHLAGKEVDSQSWDAAIDVVQQSVIGIAVASKLNQLGDDPVLSEVYRHCEHLRAKDYLEVVKTNRDLARIYAISHRTVTNWRKEGCPFEDGQWAVLDWLAERRYAPAGAKAKFEKQLSERKDKAEWAHNSGRARIDDSGQATKSRYQFHGLKPPDWLRGFRATAGAKFNVTTVRKTGQISNKD